MSTIKVYGGRMGSSLRVHWALAELGQPYETVEVSIRDREHKQAEFLSINPAGQIPAIDVDGVKLAESVAIVQYLCEKFKPELLGATPEERAKALQWGIWAMYNVQKHLLAMAFQVWNNAPDEAMTSSSKEALAGLLPIIDALLGTQAYVAGDTFTTGDIIAACTMTYGEVSGHDYTPYVNLTRWLADVYGRPAYKTATGK